MPKTTVRLPPKSQHNLAYHEDACQHDLAVQLQCVSRDAVDSGEVLQMMENRMLNTTLTATLSFFPIL